MVVIGEHRPGLQLPLILLRQIKQQVAKVLEALMAGKRGLLQVRGASYDVSSRQFQAVNRAVRPIAHKIPSIWSAAACCRFLTGQLAGRAYLRD